MTKGKSEVDPGPDHTADDQAPIDAPARELMTGLLNLADHMIGAIEAMRASVPQASSLGHYVTEARRQAGDLRARLDKLSE
jgi:hypothetical protein